MQHLEAATKHCLTVIAKDGAGHEAKRYVNFTTHRRFVIVTIAEILVINDSDSGGSGEIEFWIKLSTIEFQQFVEETSIASGHAIHPNKQYTVANSPTTVEVSVTGFDDDGPIELEWSEAEIVLDVGGPGGPGEIITAKSFSTTSTPIDGNLKFKVSGTFDVTYAP
jgi:hypothetical protein